MRRALTAAVVIFVLGVSCSRSQPTAAVPLAAAPGASAFADFSGISVVEYRLTSCVGLRDCSFYLGRTSSLELRLQQSGASVTGLLAVSPTNTVKVSGTVSGDGALTLSGSRRAVATVSWAGDTAQEITSFRLRRDRAGHVTGSVVLTSDGNWPDTGRVIQGGEFTSMSRVGGLGEPAGFAGTWRGRALTRACSATGQPYCYPTVEGEMSDFTLTLSPSGDRLEGTLSGIAPVSGTADGDQLVLTGRSTPSGSSSYHATITGWSTYRDQFGQLHGTFTYVNESPARRTTYEMELYFVTLEVK